MELLDIMIFRRWINRDYLNHSSSSIHSSTSFQMALRCHLYWTWLGTFVSSGFSEIGNFNFDARIFEAKCGITKMWIFYEWYLANDILVNALFGEWVSHVVGISVCIMWLLLRLKFMRFFSVTIRNAIKKT